MARRPWPRCSATASSSFSAARPNRWWPPRDWLSSSGRARSSSARPSLIFSARAAPPGQPSADWRAVAGEQPARTTLIDTVYRPLLAHPTLLDTATTFLELGGTIEATARHLYVHTNTVRYRLGRICEVIGYDITVPREAFTVHLALAMGRLDAARRSRARDLPAAPPAEPTT
jgi:hypothetical protein